MYKVLLMEDDQILAETLKELLESENFEVKLAKNGNKALDLSFEEKFDIYLLDVNVPFLNGFDFLKELRESGDETPAFFITALKDIESLSKGFQAGCDDYIKKPFDFEELIVRIKAKLKTQNDILKYGDIEYNLINKTIKKNGEIIDLPLLDKEIFLLFLKNIDKIINKEDIFDLLDKPTDLALRVHISKIKKALNINIKNLRGLGYKLEKI